MNKMRRVNTKMMKKDANPTFINLSKNLNILFCINYFITKFLHYQINLFSSNSLQIDQQSFLLVGSTIVVKKFSSQNQK